MSGFFLTPGSPEWAARQVEIAEREAHNIARQEARIAAIEADLAAAEHDLEGARLLELAQLLNGDSFRQRKEGLARVDQLRRGPRGNDPDYQRTLAIYDRLARLEPEAALTKARAVMELIRSWGNV